MPKTTKKLRKTPKTYRVVDKDGALIETFGTLSDAEHHMAKHEDTYLEGEELL